MCIFPTDIKAFLNRWLYKEAVLNDRNRLENF